MKVKAYKWDNSSEVELTEISRVTKTRPTTGADNWNEANTPFSTFSYVDVKVYEPGNRYHYSVRITDIEHGTTLQQYAYSSSRWCDPQVVANELIKKYQ